MGIPLSELSADEVVFSHIDEDTGAQTHYAISQMLKWIHREGLTHTTVPVEEAAAEMVASSRGIERHRLAPLLRVPVDNYPPIVFVACSDGTHLLVDGSHRYVAAFGRHADVIKAYVLNETQASMFVIEGIPMDPNLERHCREGYSGL